MIGFSMNNIQIIYLPMGIWRLMYDAWEYSDGAHEGASGKP